MKKGIFFFAVLLSQYAIGQVVWAKEYSKEIALHHAKTFVIKEILGETTEVVKFEVDPLAAASSGELTTLLFQCDGKKRSGLILGFFGTRVTDAGVTYQSFEFKDLSMSKAHELLGKIETVLKDDESYLGEQFSDHNIYFTFDDLTVLISGGNYNNRIRIYWKDFDSTWNASEMRKTRRRLTYGTQ